MVGSRKTTLGKTDHRLLTLVLVLTSYSDEHQRRSPDCVFFALSTTAKPKAGRSKKGRASKASRISTQSNFTTVSEGVSVADTDVHGDDSIISVVEPPKTAKSGKGSKKSSKAKKPAVKSKRQANRAVDESTQAASSFLEPEDDDFEVKVEIAPTQSKGNKKRKSDGISTTNEVSNISEAHNQEQELPNQPRKRRATRTRGSLAPTSNAPSHPPQEDHHDQDAQMPDVEEPPQPVLSQGQKIGKGGRKRGSSKVRKAPAASTASIALLRANIPLNEEIDAALEAELDRPLTDEEGDIEPPAVNEPKGRHLTRTKPSSRKATASVASTRRTTRASTVMVDEPATQDISLSLPDSVEDTHVPTSKRNEDVALVHYSLEQSSLPGYQRQSKGRNSSEQQSDHGKEPENSKSTIAAAEDKLDDEMSITEPQRPKSRQARKQMPARKARVSDLPSSFESMDLASDINSSMLDTQTAQDDSGHETDANVVKQARTKCDSKKAPPKKGKGNKKIALNSRNIEDIVQPMVNDVSPEEQGTNHNPVNDHIGSVETISVEVEKAKKQRKPSRAIAKSGKTKKTPPEPEVFAQEGSTAPLIEQPSPLAEAEITRPSPHPPSAHSTHRPAPSRQSSDAENQPPSSRPSIFRPPLSIQSPSESQSIRVPLAVTTPVSSPSRNNLSKLQTTFPWTAIELEHIFEGTPTVDKENGPVIFGEAVRSADTLLTSPEKEMTVEQWVQFNAQRGEEKLRNECERLVGKFEHQGVRALRVLEGIVCAERLS